MQMTSPTGLTIDSPSEGREYVGEARSTLPRCAEWGAFHTAGLSLTLNLTTNSTIPISQPLSCVSLSCANLSLSLTLQISQWSSSIETASSDYRFSGVSNLRNEIACVACVELRCRLANAGRQNSLY